MTAFTTKPITQPDRVCYRLKEAREAAGFTLEQISERTKLQKNYIEALESCSFDHLPYGDAYRKQFIKAYLKALDINPATYLFQYTNEEVLPSTETKTYPARANRHLFHNIPSYLRISSLIIGSFLMLGYLGWQVKHIVEPPDMTLHNPPNGFVTTDSALVVQGQTNKEVFVTINGKQVANNGSGQFEERIDLSPGVNTITISAKRKYGKSTILTRHVVLKQSQQLSADTANVPPTPLP